MITRINRRAFVQAAAGGAAAWWILGNSRSVRAYQANEKLNLAVVGVGSRGSHLARVVRRLEQNLVALCDVDLRRAEPWREQEPEVPWYWDFRVMLDELDERLDGVMAALPFHTHAAVAAAAIRQGKHVYVEKPIGHHISELVGLRQLAAEQGVATQMGNQGMATDSFRRTVELVRQGAAGEIREAWLWHAGGGPGPRELPTGEQPVPEGLDWDLWLGPRAARPFHQGWLSWWPWREFSSGSLGGWGSHAANMIFMGLRLGALWGTDGQAEGTIQVRAEPSDVCENCHPRRETTEFDIPARGDLPPVRIRWFLAPRGELEERGIWKTLEELAGRPPIMEGSWTPESGSMLAGSRGVVHTNSHNSVCHLLPEEEFPQATEPPQELPRVRGHKPEWMDACRGTATPISNIDHSGPMMEMLYLSHVAGLFPEQTLEYDPKQSRIVNLEEANRWLTWPRRENWELF